MALDVHICGPGFGEMILLRWEENGSPRAALVDIYSPSPDVDPLMDWLETQGVRHLSFVAITHPHLDHINNAGAVLRRFAGRIDHVWFWPGLNQAAYAMYFNKLACRFPQSPNHLQKRARAVSDFFGECKRQFFDQQLGRPILQPLQRLTRIYPAAGPTQQIEVNCISPWDAPSMRFINLVAAGIAPGGVVTDTHREANLVSAGFVIAYGASTVLLGGDMEHENWAEWINSGGCSNIAPCLVKVSHHGSPTACVNGMWQAGGFFGRSRPVAVITPWNRTLPVQGVLDEIVASGAETYVTGQQRPRMYDNLSRVQIRVYGDNRPAAVVFKSQSVKRL